MELEKFRLLPISDHLSDKIWDEVQKWNRFNQDTIGKQFVRAADSISANLSEAYGRFSYPDRKRFAFIARGSLCETITWLGKCLRRGLIDNELGEELNNELERISYKLNLYIRSLNISIAKHASNPGKAHPDQS